MQHIGFKFNNCSHVIKDYTHFDLRPQFQLYNLILLNT